MITRKSKSADLSQKRNLFFSIGLVVSLLVVITAFEWKFYDDGSLANLNSDVDAMFDEVLDIPPTEQPPPPPPKKAFVNIVEVPDLEEIEEEIEISLDIDVTEEMVVEEMQVTVPDVEEEEEAEEIFTIVEHTPQPKGGYEAFYQFMYDNIKYPRQALRSSVEGKVFVQFVVSKDGSLSEFAVIKGIGGGCDEEAIRVLALAPNWKPGKQRGKPVNVRMIIPIQFSLE